MLATMERGSGPPVVLVHGFTQTARSWEGLTDRLPASRRYVSVDLPGHGASSAISASFAETAELVGSAGGEADYVGYSLGGRVCLHLALSSPSLVRSLILISASPGIDEDHERQARLERDERLAGFIESAGVEVFLERWLDQPMFAGLAPLLSEQMEQRKGNDAAGLARSLRELGTGVMDPVWDRLHRLHMPVLIITGERDDRFTSIGRAMTQMIPNATHREVAGVGHAAHLEAPDAVAALIEEFLGRHGSGSPTS